MSRMILKILAQEYSGWESISLRSSMEGLAHGFEVSLADIGDFDVSAIAPEAPVELIGERDDFSRVTLFTGYVDTRSRTRNSNRTGLIISGRSKTADLVDCGAIYTTSTFLNIKLVDMARALCSPFGVSVVSQLTEGENVGKYTIKPGASVFSVLEENARKLGVILTTDGKGRLVLGYSDAATPTTENLVDGVNLKTLTENRSSKRLHSKYIMKGQGTAPGGKPWEKKATSKMSASVVDPLTTRYRPLVKVADGKTSTAKLRKQAEWEKRVRRGRSVQYVATKDGWFQGVTGLPWQINQTVNLTSQYYGVNLSYLITEVELTKSSEGTTTSMTLKDKETYASVEQ